MAAARRKRLLRAAWAVLVRVVAYGGLALLLSPLPAALMIRMPGESFRGELPAQTEAQRELARRLRRDVEALAGRIGPRNLEAPGSLEAAAGYIEASLRESGYDVRRQAFSAYGRTCHNLEAALPGAAAPEEIVVLGAHYDSVEGSPGADDNASGVAAGLALARAFARREAPPRRTVRFVFFANEEPPHFMDATMGSRFYARRARERGENIAAMVSLESLGYYDARPGSQAYPVAPLRWLYPSTADFIAFVSDLRSRGLLRRALGAFRSAAAFPSEGAALPAFIPGVALSDHWSFWEEGYPAIMVTDTVPFRSPYYHRASDTPGTLDYDRMARVVEGLQAVAAELAG